MIWLLAFVGGVAVVTGVAVGSSLLLLWFLDRWEDRP